MCIRDRIVHVVSQKIDEYNLKVVVDPVMIAKTGYKLLLEEAIEALKRELISKELVVTPNIPESEVIVGFKIKSIEDMKKAAEDLSKLGAEAVVIKGGHLIKDKAVTDILYYKKRFYELKKSYVQSKCTHGTGCTFSAAITALIAKGKNILEAVIEASKFISKAIKFGIEIGRGYGSVNPMVELYKKASKFDVWSRVHEAVRIIEANKAVIHLIPEVRMNIGEAIEYPENLNDICAIEGRITVVNGKPRASGCPKFGASSHIARIILTAMKFHENIRAAANIRYSNEILQACKRLGFKVAFIDRRIEPKDAREIEGASLPWIIERAMTSSGEVPDAIYDLGDIGKEPMIRILGENAIDVANKIVRIANELNIKK